MREQQGDGVSRRALSRALVALYRYTVELTEVARLSLGGETTENRDIEIVLTVARVGPVTPTDLGVLTGAPRSSVSRAISRLEAAGLIVRRPDPRDGRSVLLVVTPRARRRVAAFAGRLASFFDVGAPLLKEALDLLEVPVPAAGTPSGSCDPLAAASGLTRAGAAFSADATAVLEPLGVREFADRFTIALLELYGTQRPTQIADELGLTPSGTSGLLTRLERAGLLTRRHDLTPGDRRAVVVELTGRGREAAMLQLDLLAQHAPALAAALSSTVGADAPAS